MKKIAVYSAAAAVSLTVLAGNLPNAAATPANPAAIVSAPDTAPVPSVRSIDAPADFDGALANAGTEFGLATGVGSMLGMIVGAPLGCVAGSAVGDVLMPAVFVAGPIGGCIAGTIAGLALAPASGTVALGVPTGIAAAIQFLNAVNTPAADAPADAAAQ